MKIIDYTVVSSLYGDTNELRKEVNKKILNNWQPYGPICVSNNIALHQAMVKYEEEAMPIFD